MSEDLKRDLELLEARLHNTEVLLQAVVQLVVAKDEGALQKFAMDQFYDSHSLGAFQSNTFKNLKENFPVSEPTPPDNLEADLSGAVRDYGAL